MKYVLTILWMAVIFYLSNEPANFSTARSDIILRTVQSVDISFLSQATELLIRKSAHFVAYLILGVLIYSVVKEYIHNVPKSVYIAVLFACLYASTDELHQLFVPGRSGQLSDVLIDTTGAAVGVSVYVGIASLRQRQAKNKLSFSRPL